MRIVAICGARHSRFGGAASRSPSRAGATICRANAAGRRVAIESSSLRSCRRLARRLRPARAAAVSRRLASADAAGRGWGAAGPVAALARRPGLRGCRRGCRRVPAAGVRRCGDADCGLLGGRRDADARATDVPAHACAGLRRNRRRRLGGFCLRATAAGAGGARPRRAGASRARPFRPHARRGCAARRTHRITSRNDNTTVSPPDANGIAQGRGPRRKRRLVAAGLLRNASRARASADAVDPGDGARRRGPELRQQAPSRAQLRPRARPASPSPSSGECFVIGCAPAWPARGRSARRAVSRRRSAGGSSPSRRRRR